VLSFVFSNNYQRHHHQHHSLIMCKLQKTISTSQCYLEHNVKYVGLVHQVWCALRTWRHRSNTLQFSLVMSEAQLWAACEFCADNLFSAYTPTVETVEKPEFTTYAAANSICCLDTVINYTCDLSLGRPSHHSAKTANQCPPETSLKRWVYWHTI